MEEEKKQNMAHFHNTLHLCTLHQGINNFCNIYLRMINGTLHHGICANCDVFTLAHYVFTFYIDVCKKAMHNRSILLPG